MYDGITILLHNVFRISISLVEVYFCLCNWVCEKIHNEIKWKHNSIAHYTIKSYFYCIFFLFFYCLIDRNDLSINYKIYNPMIPLCYNFWITIPITQTNCVMS